MAHQEIASAIVKQMQIAQTDALKAANIKLNLYVQAMNLLMDRKGFNLLLCDNGCDKYELTLYGQGAFLYNTRGMSQCSICYKTLCAECASLIGRNAKSDFCSDKCAAEN